MDNKSRIRWQKRRNLDEAEVVLGVVGGGAIQFACVQLTICLGLLDYVKNLETDSLLSLVINIFALVNLFAFVGLIIIGLFIFVKSRYLLIVLIPFSIIGLMAIPSGPICYIFIVRELWIYMHNYFPFDKNQMFNLEDKADDT